MNESQRACVYLPQVENASHGYRRISLKQIVALGAQGFVAGVGAAGGADTLGRFSLLASTGDDAVDSPLAVFHERRDLWVCGD